MRRREIELLLNYYLHKTQHLRNDVTDLSDRYNLRRVDEVDHLESIIAIVRLKAFEEFMADIIQILHLTDDSDIFD
ncbi:MAG: hypothetical protein K2H01_08275 [Ruminococcus sp.]|nr:hypothetical protein [Ruminococcus sp.]